MDATSLVIADPKTTPTQAAAQGWITDYDVFFSYRRLDQAEAMGLCRALRQAGLRVFLDEDDINDGESISARLEQALAQSRLLLAWYSADYPKSRACQWELTAAMLAGMAADALGARVMAVNPEANPDHIHPFHLRDHRLLSAVDIAETVRRVTAQLAALTTPMAAVRGPQRPDWLIGTRPAGWRRFVGRLAELWQVHGHLNTAAKFAAIAGAAAKDALQVQGMGGIGKSLLAEEYALRFGAAYPGGIIWLSANQPPSDALFSLALRCGLSVEGLRPEAVAGLLRSHLTTQPAYLWVVDDLSPQAGEADLRSWMAPSANGRTLVTTRGTGLDGFGNVLRLDVLRLAEAVELLLKHRPAVTEAEHAAATAIVTDLGRHALAVEVAGAAVGRMGFSHFLERLADRSQDVLDLAAKLTGQLPAGHEANIAATLLHSVDCLEPEGLRVLQLASLLAVEPIPLPLIDGVFGEDAALLGVKDTDRHSLTGRDGDAVTVHALVSRTIRVHRPAPAELAQAAAVEVLKVMPGVTDIRNHERLAYWVAHARALAEGPEDEGTFRLLLRLGQLEDRRGNYAAAVALNDKVLQGASRVLGEEHSVTLAARNNLADMLRAQGDLAGARALHEQALAVCRRVLGEDHPDTLISMNNLAATLYAQGDLAGARALHEQVLAVRRRVLGEDHPNTLISMNNLASTLHAQGNLAEARALKEQVLAMCRRVLGEDHPSTLISMGNLASTLHAQGNLTEARVLREQVLATHRRVLGEEHADTLISMNNLANTLHAQGDLAGARALHEQELSICRRVLGEEHPDTLTSMNNLAATHYAQGDLAGARALQEQVLAVHCRVLGEDHSNTLISIHNFAAILVQVGEIPRARALVATALPVARGKLGDPHPITQALQRLATRLGAP